MRTLSAALLAAQQADNRVPAIRVLINSVDYSSRLLFVEHHEEPHRDYTTIVLDNADRGLDSVATASTNLLGHRFRIAYGYVTGNVVAEPNGDGATKEYVDSADLWVKGQQMISKEGQLFCVLFCEGQWTYLREQHVMAMPAATSIEITAPSKVKAEIEGGNADTPYFAAVFERTKTVYELIELIIEGAFSWTLNATPSPDDGILNDFRPVKSIEEHPYASVLLRELIQMTKCYLRPKANLIWEIIFPQESDAADETYYSSQSPYFLEYAENISLVIPNRIVIFAGNENNETPWPTPVIVGDTGAYSGSYVEVLEPDVAPTIMSQTDADNRAAAILTRYNSERQSGYIVIHHDARVELYDKVEALDSRDL